jgi:hypothetical protein
MKMAWKEQNFRGHYFSSFLLEYSIKVVKENENVLKLKAQFSFQSTTDDVNLLAKAWKP